MFRRRGEILEETIVTIVQALRLSSSAGRVIRHRNSASCCSLEMCLRLPMMEWIVVLIKERIPPFLGSF